MAADGVRWRAVSLPQIGDLTMKTLSEGSESQRCVADLLNVGAVAEMLDCSTRHVLRLADAAKMPRPIKLGSLARWRRSDIEKWVADGCPRTGKV